MVKTMLWIAGLSFAVITTTSCKKKTEDPMPLDPEKPLAEKAPIFRPTKIYKGTDSTQLKLWFEYSYDAMGRVSEGIAHMDYRPEDPAYAIVLIKQRYQYSSSFEYINQTFLNRDDQKYYWSGYDSSYIENGKVSRNVTFNTYYSTILKGIDTVGVKKAKEYSYNQGDSLEIVVKISDPSSLSDGSTSHYLFNKKKELQSYAVTLKGATTPYSSSTFVYHSDNKGRFEPHIALSNSNVAYTGLLTEIQTTGQGLKPYTRYNKWYFDSQNRPILVANITISEFGTSKEFYGFEY